jgi:hypothetical protein
MQFRFGLIAKYDEILAQNVLIKTKTVLVRTNLLKTLLLHLRFQCREKILFYLYINALHHS